MITYTLSLGDPAAHLFSIEITAPVDGATHVDLEMPAWSPGRYYIYDFARNLQELGASDEQGRPLAVDKIAKGRWRVSTDGAERITVRYRMFGNTLSGTFSQLDDRHAAVNGPSVFAYLVGRVHEPVELTIDAPDDWRVHTSLKKRRRDGRQVWSAENYDVLIDSPLEIGRPTVRTFSYRNAKYHLVLDIAASSSVVRTAVMRERIDRYVSDAEKIVRAYVDTFGDPEFRDYYFLVNIDPYAESGDGMEHLASTRLVINGYITDDDVYDGLLDVTSHEFFHIWNVKRLRPAELGPFDYSRERHTTLLWFAEGFTQYYGHLMVRRAGVWNDRTFFKRLAGEFTTVDRSPGRHHRTLREASFDTWIAGGSRSPLGTASNIRNTYVNYYNKGAVVACLLDMELRRITKNARSLDDVIRELYRTTYLEADHDAYYLPGSGYTEQDVYDAVAAVAGRSLRAFLRRAIESTEDIDARRYLRYVGLELRRGDAAKRSSEEENQQLLFTGIMVHDMKPKFPGEFVTLYNVIEGSPAAEAGLSAGDVVIAVDGERLDKRNWKTVMSMKSPGSPLELTIFRGSRLMTIRVRSIERDMRPLSLVELPRQTEAQKRNRRIWLEP